MVLTLALASCNRFKTNQSSDSPDAPKAVVVGFTEKGSVSFAVLDIASDEFVLQENSHQRMTPASLTKLFTTGAALSKLGADYTYSTPMYLRKRGDGKLYDLLIIGSGDPTIGSKNFKSHSKNQFFEEVKDAIIKNGGLKNIGDIVLDNSRYGSMRYPSKRLWEDMSNYFGAVPRGLTYEENTFTLKLSSPGKTDAKCAVISVEPDIEVRFDCDVTASSINEDRAYIYGYPGLDKWIVGGTIPLNQKSFAIKGATPYPWKVMGNDLKKYLQKAGVGVKGEVRKGTFNVKECKHIGSYTSPTLLEIAKVVNKKSHNLFADHLLFEFAGSAKNDLYWEVGTSKLTRFWQSKIDDFSGDFYDGSGLSPFNAFSAYDMVKALAWLDKSKVGSEFRETLAAGGEEGTLRSIFKNSKVKGRIIGKSGTLNEVLGYAGYIKTDSGKNLAFCIIFNKFTESYPRLRSDIDEYLTHIVSNY